MAHGLPPLKERRVKYDELLRLLRDNGWRQATTGMFDDDMYLRGTERLSFRIGHYDTVMRITSGVHWVGGTRAKLPKAGAHDAALEIIKAPHTRVDTFDARPRPERDQQ
jgi:hypothetical protein